MAKKVKKLKEFLSDQPKEIAEGITVSKLSPIFFDATRLIHQPETMYRLDTKKGRLYYRFNGEEPQFFTSVTTFIKQNLPTAPQLIEWMVRMGEEKGKEIANESSLYGTLYHTECGVLMMTGKYDLDKISTKIEEYCLKEKLPYKREWEDDLKKDILSFAQFMIDCNVKPLAIEIILWHPDGYAGAIDLVASLDVEERGFFGEKYLSGEKKGQDKESKRVRRVNAIIDLKSGKKGFYESYEIQLHAYGEMLKHHYPDLEIERYLNFSPKDWRTTPSYNLKDQTDSKNASKLPHLVGLMKVEAEKREDKVTLISGQIDLTKGLEGHVSELTYVELIKKNR